MNTNEVTRHSSKINKAEFKRQLIERARASGYYWGQVEGIRVSALTVELAEAALDVWMRRHVEGLARRGKTL